MIKLTELERLEVIRDYMITYRELQAPTITDAFHYDPADSARDEGELRGIDNILAEVNEGIEARNANSLTETVVRNGDLRTLPPYVLHVMFNWLFSRVDTNKALYNDPYDDQREDTELTDAKYAGRRDELDECIEDVRQAIDSREEGIEVVGERTPLEFTKQAFEKKLHEEIRDLGKAWWRVNSDHPNDRSIDEASMDEWIKEIVDWAIKARGL